MAHRYSPLTATFEECSDSSSNPVVDDKCEVRNSHEDLLEDNGRDGAKSDNKTSTDDDDDDGKDAAEPVTKPKTIPRDDCDVSKDRWYSINPDNLKYGDTPCKDHPINHAYEFCPCYHPEWVKQPSIPEEEEEDNKKKEEEKTMTEEEAKPMTDDDDDKEDDSCVFGPPFDKCVDQNGVVWVKDQIDENGTIQKPEPKPAAAAAGNKTTTPDYGSRKVHPCVFKGSAGLCAKLWQGCSDVWIKRFSSKYLANITLAYMSLHKCSMCQFSLISDMVLTKPKCLIFSCSYWISFCVNVLFSR